VIENMESPPPRPLSCEIDRIIDHSARLTVHRTWCEYESDPVIHTGKRCASL